MCSAVALILFNRPDTTEAVMREIAKAKPAKLFLIADGPRPGRPDDVEKCAAARAAAERLVDWDCEVFKRYSKTNVGCGWGPAGGITWVFEHVEEAIILEDDCVPDPSFFRFCTEMLARFRDDPRVMHVSGNFRYFGSYSGTESYFFSRHNVSAGGFATWRRAWRHFDAAIKTWASLRESPWLLYVTADERANRHWRAIFDRLHAEAGRPEMHDWDYQWTFACWSQNGLSVVSHVGLLTNIGYRPDGTHTKGTSRWADLPRTEIVFPLVHPTTVTPDAIADRGFMGEVFYRPPEPSFLQNIRIAVVLRIPTPIRRLAARVRSMLSKTPAPTAVKS